MKRLTIRWICNMYMPFAQPIKKNRDMVSAFRGYNHNLRIENKDYIQFYDMANMTSDLLPVASPRSLRGRVRKLTKPNGLFAHDKLCWVDGTSFYYNGASKGTVADSAKQFVRMGAYVLIWPDKKYYNASTDTFGDLGATFTSTPGATITAVLCRADGEAYTYTTGDVAPTTPADGDYWIDTSGTTDVLKVYSESYGMWNSVPTVHVKISGTGIGSNFADGDGVTISGMSDSALNGNFVIEDCAAGYIIVTAVINANTTQTTSVTVARVIPTLDFITECQNRVWGCSSTNHEIYACKLGDPKNWNVFQGISTDSYTATVGSGGNFTGATTHMGYVLFFKENRIHKLYGTQPSNFTLSEDAVRGVASGSEKSIAIVNETLIYHAKSGVCTYGMALPESISYPLGVDAYSNAVAGACVNKYYMSAYKDGVYEMLVYDTRTGVWMKEDDAHVLYMAELGNDLYFVDSDGYLWSVAGNITDYILTEPVEGYGTGEGPEAEDAFEWMVETGDIGMDLPDHKYISGIRLLVAAAVGSELTLSAQCDGGTWKTVKTFAKLPGKNMITIPYVTPRCYSMKLRIEGTGDIKLYSITKSVEMGSDVRV